MPRTGRVVLPHCPHHVVQRGHNRQAVFTHERDFRRYLGDLRELTEELNIRVHAYCLMTNHLHLLLAPDESTASLARLMKTLAARATRHHNKQEGRSGTLWESRYKSSPVQTDAYLLACSRYIELNPVRARMVAEPGDYPWSSYLDRLDTPEAECWLHPDPFYLSLGGTESARKEGYARFIRSAVPDSELDLIRGALQRGQLTGNQQFVEEVSQFLGRRLEVRGPGRPKRTDTA